jgi:hypothetical protein
VTEEVEAAELAPGRPARVAEEAEEALRQRKRRVLQEMGKLRLTAVGPVRERERGEGVTL